MTDLRTGECPTAAPDPSGSSTSRVSRPLIRPGSLQVALFLAAVSLLSLFFINFAVFGAYGARARDSYRAELDRLERQLNELRSEASRLETLTAGLSAESLDIDLLDERARLILGTLRADEIVITP